MRRFRPGQNLPPIRPDRLLARATFNGQVIASSGDTVVVEANHRFPPDLLRWEHFTESDTTSVCPWKGTAGHFTVEADGKSDRDAAWINRTPKGAAATSRTTSRSGAEWSSPQPPEDRRAGNGCADRARCHLDWRE